MSRGFDEAKRGGAGLVRPGNQCSVWMGSPARSDIVDLNRLNLAVELTKVRLLLEEEWGVETPSETPRSALKREAGWHTRMSSR